MKEFLLRLAMRTLMVSVTVPPSAGKPEQVKNRPRKAPTSCVSTPGNGLVGEIHRIKKLKLTKSHRPKQYIYTRTPTRLQTWFL